MNVPSIVYPVLSALSAFFFALSLIPGEDPVTKKLDELRKPSKDRGKFFPAEQFLERTLSEKQRGHLQQKLSEAGWYRVPVSRMVARMIGAGLLGVTLALFAIQSFDLHTTLWYIIAVLGVAAAAYLPYAVLDRAAEKRKREVQRALPDFLDMVATTVQAGLSLNAAMAYAVDSATGTLATEMREALTEIRMGRSRQEALQATADRLNQIEFTTMVSAILQCERLGSNIGAVLTELADDTRSHRILLAEEQAQKLPVKMVFPMAFFMMPALFTIIFGSIISNLLARH